MRTIPVLVFALVAVAATSAAASTEIELTIRDGRVSLLAKDATVRQILTEWARIGQTTVINVERLPGGPVTLQLTNVSEEQALDVLLRSVSGYMLAPRPTVVSNLSRFDRIIVMPTSVAPRAAAVAPTPTPMLQPPQFAQPVAAPGALGTPGAAAEDDGADSRPAPTVALPVNRGPVFTFPQPQVVNPQAVPNPAGVTGGVPAQQPVPAQLPNAATAPTAYPSAPTAPVGGVAVPGMVAPPPQGAQPGAITPAPNGPGQ